MDLVCFARRELIGCRVRSANALDWASLSSSPCERFVRDLPVGPFSLIYEEGRDTAGPSLSNTMGSEFRRLYRKHLAISLDWNDLEAQFWLDVPPDATVSGWVGITKAQPIVSASEQARLGRPISGVLKGGLEQIFVEHLNATWIRRVYL